jgi:hypothetical protein
VSHRTPSLWRRGATRYLIAAMFVLATSLLYAASAQAWRRLDQAGFATDERQTCTDGARLGIAYGRDGEPTGAGPLSFDLVAATEVFFPPLPENVIASPRGLALERNPVSLDLPSGPDSAPFSGTFVIRWSHPVQPGQQLGLSLGRDGNFTGFDVLTVQDCVLQPLTKEECKNGDWRNFAGVRNQGGCVAFVQRGPRP